MPCVFIIALGRTGSTHLLRLLNSIEGYRVSGETDNAWIYLGWWHASQHAKAASLASAGESSGDKRRLSSASKRGRKRPEGHGKAQPPDSPLAGAMNKIHSARDLCAMRELMLLVHNPVPRSRVFGFKEIYTPFVRDPSGSGEVLTHGVTFLRTLFPRARFVFHSRRNLTRAADSDFWKWGWRAAGAAQPSRSERVERITGAAERYRAYVQGHPDHAFSTTLEGITDREDKAGELAGLFRFLGEPLTGRVKKVARSNPQLRDWAECAHGARSPPRPILESD